MARIVRNTLKVLLTCTAFCGLFVAFAQDPPSRVAALNFVTGNVSMRPAGSEDWFAAAINRPRTTGDYLWADADACAELHLNNTVLRLGSRTSVRFLNLDDRMAQIRFPEGEFIIRVRHLGEDESIEVDTPNAAITILREGEYRFNADPDNETTLMVVRHGQAELTGGGQAFAILAGDSARLSGTGHLAYDFQYAPAQDWLEGWSQERDAREARSQSQPAPPRPYEAAPRPQPAPAPRVAPPEHREPKPERREDKSDKDKPKH